MTFKADRFERLDKYLARVLPDHSRTKLAKLIEERGVSVNDKAQKPSFVLTPGDTVKVTRPVKESVAHDLTPADIPLDILYEDDQLLVVNKPRGLATHPAASLKEPSLVNALLGRSTLSAGSEPYRPGIVHRLDRETTGLLIVAKTDSAHWKLARQIAAKTAERRYVAVVEGELGGEPFRIDAPIGRDRKNRVRMAVDPLGKPAVTHVLRLGEVEQGTVVVVQLETGRTHQIRVHLKAIGHPVVGDVVYNLKKTALPLQLHAAFISFDHPLSGEKISIFSAPPDDFVGKGLATEREVTAPLTKF